MKDKKCLMLPKVAGRSVQWIEEAEGGASADWCSKRCFLSFIIVWMVVDWIVIVQFLRENKFKDQL